MQHLVVHKKFQLWHRQVGQSLVPLMQGIQMTADLERDVFAEFIELLLPFDHFIATILEFSLEHQLSICGQLGWAFRFKDETPLPCENAVHALFSNLLWKGQQICSKLAINGFQNTISLRAANTHIAICVDVHSALVSHDHLQ
jgi:hypothetical protein